MNWDQITGHWEQFRGQVKAKWDKITDDDLTTIAGKRGQLTDLLQVRYGYDKAQSEKELDALALALKPVKLPQLAGKADAPPVGGSSRSLKA